MSEIIKFPRKTKSAPKSRSRRKGTRPQAANVITFPSVRPRYSLDVIGKNIVDQMVLIEACIPVGALDALMAYLRAASPARA
jgi:hypothetical protein